MANFPVKIVHFARNLMLGAVLAAGVAGGAQAAGDDYSGQYSGNYSGGPRVYQSGGYDDDNDGGYGGGHGGYGGGYHGGYEGHGGYGYDRVCRPREAVERAYRQGMRRPGVERITRREVVIGGWFRGHRAMLVFDRYSSRCRVLYSRGI